MKTSKQKTKKEVAFILFFLVGIFMSVTAFATSDATMIIANPGEDASTEMRISWHTDVSVTGSFVEYTKKSDITWANARKVVGSCELSTTWNGVTSIISSSQGNFVQDITVNKCGAVLSNLDPDTDYMYRVGLNELTDTRYFKTAGADEYSFAWISDYHAYDPLPGRLTAAMNMIGKLIAIAGSGGINFILSTGDDVAYGGSYTYWQNVFAHEHYKNYMWVTMIGNHDHMDRTDSKNTDAYYRDTHNNPPNGYPGQEGCSYWFKYGDVLWIVLNTEDLNTSAQVPKAQAWLEQVIQNNPSKFIFVAEHYQWFNGVSGAANTGFSRWYPLFDKYGVTLALSGNNHIYVRTKALSDNELSIDPAKGTVYMQASSSDNDRGQAMKDLSLNADKIAYRWSEGTSTVGGILVKVGKDKINVCLYDRNGVALDEADIPEEPPVPVPPVITDVTPKNVDAVNIKNPIELTFSRNIDRTSLESAVRFLPEANVSYTWPKDHVVRIDISQLNYETDYTLTIDGSIAKSVEGKFLDGENNGTEGSDYVLNFTTAPAVEDMEGDYYVPFDPGGGKKWFPTLKDACDAINTNPIAGDVNLWVTDNIASSDNVGLVNNTDHSITIKSYGHVRRSITFSSDKEPEGPSASFLIGCGSDLTWNDIAPAKNITLDSLTILTSSTSGGNIPILIVDACKDITIRNCSIRHLSSSGSYAVYLRGFVNRTEPNIQKKMPENITIEGNEITHLARGSGQAIGINADAAPTAANRVKGLVIKDNILTARTRGVFLNYVDGMIFTGNEINISQNGTYNSMGMYASNMYGAMTIAGNKFIKLTTVVTTASSDADYGIKGIYVSGSGATWHIDNNYFAGFNKTSGSGSASLHAIHFTGSSASATTTFIRHNTFYMGALSNIPTGNTATPVASNTDPAYAMIFLTSGTATIKNNLFVGSEDRFPNFFFKGEAPVTDADNNVFCTPATTAHFNIASSGIVPSNLQMAENVVFTDPTTGNLDILPNSSSEKDENLAVPLLPEVTTDIYGTKRGTKTYAGAHEAAPFDSEVNITNNTANGIRIVCLNNHITITSDDLIQSVEIHDLQGRAIDFKQNILNDIYSTTIQTAGVYIVKTVTGSGRSVQKVIIK